MKEFFIMNDEMLSKVLELFSDYFIEIQFRQLIIDMSREAQSHWVKLFIGIFTFHVSDFEL